MKMRKTSLITQATSGLCLWAGLCSPLAAAPMLDQLHANEMLGTGNAIGGPFTQYAQSSTVGLMGTFDSVDLRLRENSADAPTDDLVVNLYNVSGGKPDAVLGSATLNKDDITAAYEWYNFDFSGLGLAVDVGDEIAFGFSTSGYLWNVIVSDSYAGGSDHYSTPTSTPFQFSQGIDYMFRTYVDTGDSPDVAVPEPGSLALIALSLVGLFVARRRA